MAAERQLLVDISVLVHKDDQTGVQRVVRNILRALQALPTPGRQIRPVYDAGDYYAYAEGLSPAADTLIQPIRVERDDIFLGLDLCPDQLPGNRGVLEDLRRHGVQLYFVVYDLLPVRIPEMFAPGASPWFTRWLNTVCAVADGLLCISNAVEDDLRDWLEQAQIVRDGTLRLAHFPLGYDLDAAPAPAAPTSQAPSDDHEPNGEYEALLATLGAHTALLMVGTLEPRKMHGEALDAFELLWAAGLPLRLIIVGKPGWMNEELHLRISAHPELGQRLFWLDHASDAMLLQMYRSCTALLAASVAEGYGLPLIEAAQHALPVIARDIPVFREVCGEHAYYFAADGGPAGLAAAIERWLELSQQGTVPASSGIASHSWADSAGALLNIILQQRWHSIGPTRLP